MHTCQSAWRRFFTLAFSCVMVLLIASPPSIDLSSIPVGSLDPGVAPLSDVSPLPAGWGNVRQANVVEKGELLSVTLPSWEPIFDVVFSPGGALLAVATSMGIHIYASQTLEELRAINTQSWVRDIAFSPDGQTLAGAVYDNTVLLWGIADEDDVTVLEGHTGWVRDVEFSPQGNLVASVSDDSTVRIWNASGQQVQSVFTPGLGGMRCLAFSDDGRILAIGAKDGVIQLWQVDGWVLKKTLKGHSDWVRTLAFSHDGRLLASGGFDATARLWHVSDGTQLHSLEGHSSTVLQVAFSPDDEILATSSVDSSIRLWNIDDGSLINELDGGSGFVYGVDIAPTGVTLISGGTDNTIKQWDLQAILSEARSDFHPDATSAEDSSDCRVCHHPQSGVLPALVPAVRCDACHLNGAAFNWCPAFQRASEVLPPYSDTAAVSGAGLGVGSDTFSVVLGVPGNGETLYVNRDVMAPMIVTGKVLAEGFDADDYSDIDVQLEIWKEGSKVTTLNTQPGKSGNFNFRLGMNQNGSIPPADEPTSIICNQCHKEYVVETYLPPGNFRLVVRASAADGAEAIDERWVQLDISRSSKMVIHLNSGTRKLTPGVSVQVSTRFYEWRGRTINAISDSHGNTEVEVETLSLAPITYAIRVPKQVVGDVLVYGENTETVTFTPGMAKVPSITIDVSSEMGEVDGRIAGDQNLPLDSVSMLATRLPAGPSYRARVANRHFAFIDLPIGRYAIFPDLGSTAAWFTNEPRIVDLEELPEVNLKLTLEASKGSIIRGSVIDADGDWLPFAWVSQSEGGSTSIDVHTGTWRLAIDKENHDRVVINAPGYYSQAIHWDGIEDTLDGIAIALRRTPEMRALKWGRGEVLIPAQTEAQTGGSIIELDYGWLWGEGESKAWIITTPEALIEISHGKFALECVQSPGCWFYIFKGKARIQSYSTDEVLEVGPEAMVSIQENGEISTMHYDAAVADVLRSEETPRVSPHWESSFLESLKGALSALGINLAMVVTIVAYIGAALMLLASSIFGLRCFFLNRSRKGVNHGESSN